MKKAEAISILATSVRPREAKDRERYDKAVNMAIEALKAQELKNVPDTNVGSMISRQAAIGKCRARLYECAMNNIGYECKADEVFRDIAEHRIGIWLEELPSVQPEITRCKDCKWWRQHTNYQGTPLSFGFCESDAMWQSLYGETCEVSHIDTDDDFYCGYAERRTE